MRKIIYSIAAMCILLFLASCGANPEKGIIGKWENVKVKGSIYEFFRDGTIVITDPREGSAATDYALLDDKHFKIMYPFGEKDVIAFSLSRNKLILKENIRNKKHVEEFRRIKQ